MLKEQDRVWIANRAHQQALCIGWVGRKHHLQTGHVAEPGLHRLRVKGAGAHPPADRRADGHRKLRSPTVVGRSEIVDDLIEAAGDEVGILNLEHGPECLQGKSHRGTHRATFDDGRITDAILSELLDESLRDLEHAAVFSDVLTENEHALVGLHSLAKTVRYGIDKAFLRACARRHLLDGGRGGPEIPALLLQRAGDVRSSECEFCHLLHLMPDFVLDGLELGLREHAVIENSPGESTHRVVLRPCFEPIFRYVPGARSFFVTAHAEGLHLQQRRTVVIPGALGGGSHDIDDLEDVVAVNRDPCHAVTGRRVGDVLDSNHFFGRR